MTSARPRPRRQLGRLCMVVATAVLATVALAPAAQARRLELGSSGTDVRHMQQRLVELGYLSRDATDGQFDQRTWHAVVAFQGWQGMTRDGIAGDGTRKQMGTARRPTPSSRQDGFEVHTDAQVLLIVRNGRTQRAIHISSGSFGTPVGHFNVYSREVMSYSRPFKVWMPYAQYFTGGIALHQGYSVPAFPASHGCVRVPAEEIDLVWRSGQIGSRVWVVTGNRVQDGPDVFKLRRQQRRQDRMRATLSSVQTLI